MSGWTNRLARFDTLLARPTSMRSLALVRILVGAVTVMHLRPIAIAALRGDTYQDVFHHAYVPALPDLPEPVYASLLIAGVVAAIAMAVGFRTHIASTVAFGVVAYHLLLSTTHVHNNRAYLVIVLGLLSVAPCGGALSLAVWIRRRRGLDPMPVDAPGWPLWLLRFECAAVYGASGLSKLVDPDWFGGTVTWGRVVAQESMVRSSAMPGFVADLVLDRSFHTVAAKLIVATELFIAGGLWWRRTRALAVTTAVMFHLMIEVGAEVQIFSYLGLAVLFVWADPSLPWLRRPGSRPADNPFRNVTV